MINKSNAGMLICLFIFKMVSITFNGYVYRVTELVLN